MHSCKINRCTVYGQCQMIYTDLFADETRLNRFQLYIMKTCPCNVYPLEPHFYIAKLGYAVVYLFFLFLLQNIDCGYSLEPPRQILHFFSAENFQFLKPKKISVIARESFRNGSHQLIDSPSPQICNFLSHGYIKNGAHDARLGTYLQDSCTYIVETQIRIFCLTHI